MLCFPANTYLAHNKIPLRYTMIPMLFMLIMTGWAMIINMGTFYLESNWLLFSIGFVVFILEIWMVAESVLVLQRAYGKKSESRTNVNF